MTSHENRLFTANERLVSPKRAQALSIPCASSSKFARGFSFAPVWKAPKKQKEQTTVHFFEMPLWSSTRNNLQSSFNSHCLATIRSCLTKGHNCTTTLLEASQSYLYRQLVLQAPKINNREQNFQIVRLYLKRSKADIFVHRFNFIENPNLTIGDIT